MRVRYLGWEDPLEEGMAICSSIPAWRILWTEKLGRPQTMGLQRVGHDWSSLACMHTHNRSITSLLQEWGSQTTMTQCSLSLDSIYFLVWFSNLRTRFISFINAFSSKLSDAAALDLGCDKSSKLKVTSKKA